MQRRMGGELVEVPTQPPIDGFPIWAQILVTLVFGLAALGVAFKGYFQRDRSSDRPKVVEPGDRATAAILAASITDMGAIRHLSDVCIRLTGAVDSLTKAIDEQAHYERNSIEIARESCQRLRELTEELQRQGRDATKWDKRNEARR